MSNLPEGLATTTFDEKPSFLQSTALNTYWQYSYINRAAFYSSIRGEYMMYMRRNVQNVLWWYDGWVPYFHNAEQGIFCTRLANALVNGLTKKVVGGHIAFKNTGNESASEGKAYELNKALAFVQKWAEKTRFETEVQKAVTFAGAAGTSLLKLDKRNDTLYAKAFRLDSFYPVIGFNGEVIDIEIYVRNFVSLKSKENYDNYYVVEHRYYGEYKKANGEVLDHAPLVSYEIRQSAGDITNSQYTSYGSIRFDRLPKSIRSDIGKAFYGIRFDSPILLPFTDLGCELVKWTPCVSNIPELPFGESLLTNILSFLQSYDYYFSCLNTDMYIGRGKVLVPKYITKDGTRPQNDGLDNMLYTKIDSPNPEKSNPVPIQFDLRATSWSEIRTHLLQDISLHLNVNLASLASFLQDSRGQRTAREISTEESETALFVEDKRACVEVGINAIVKKVIRQAGFTDNVEIRWSGAGMSNRYALTDMIATARQNGFISQERALQLFNPDMDEYQIKEELEKIKEEGMNDAFSLGQGAGGDTEGNNGFATQRETEVSDMASGLEDYREDENAEEPASLNN